MNHTAKWITGEGEIPVFFIEFEAKETQKATLRASACGIYTARLNGRPVGDDLLRPGWTNYRKRIQFQTWDVTALMQARNRLEITVAPGWWAGYLNGEGKNHFYGDRLAAWAELRLQSADGTEDIIVTNEAWHCTTGPIRSAELYHGEVIDLTVETASPGPVQPFDLPYPAALEPQIGPSVRVFRRLPVREMLRGPGGELLLDFGQNLSGFVEARIHGTRGQRVTLRHGEVLDREGRLYTENLRTARATDVFICSGGEDLFRPDMTFHGFRYVQVEGMKEIEPDWFTACAISSDLLKTADFSCSNPLVNQLWSNINWTLMDNFVDIPTDCPQRDERLGWTGDAAIFAPAAAQLRDTREFYRKWLRDLASEQSAEHGVPEAIPNILTPPESPTGGCAVWGDAATLIPWSQYRIYGDAGILREQYDSMKRWVEYMRREETPDHLRKVGHQRGDWLALDREEGRGNRGATDPYLISTAFYAESARILRDSARVLGREADAREYAALYEGIREGFRREYITATGRVVCETQTALSLILCFHLATPAQEETILTSLTENLTRLHDHLTTGFIGTPYLLKALSTHGRHDLAGRIFLQEDFPGWLQEIRLGATTLWERWDSMRPDGSFDESGMNSFNHYAFGAVGAWMLEELAGIEAKEPGYQVIAFHPRLTPGLTEVSASRETPYGSAACAWSCREGRIRVEVTVPDGAAAEILLPEREGTLSLQSGTHRWEYETDTRLEPQKYTLDSTMAVLTAHPDFIPLVNEMSPGAGENLRMDFLHQKTLRELLPMLPPEAADGYLRILSRLNEPD